MNYFNYERELIVAIMMGGATPNALEVLGKIEPEMIQSGNIRLMYSAAKDLHSKGIEFSPIEVSEKTNILLSDIMELCKTSAGSPANVKSYAKRVRQGFYLRKAESELTLVLQDIKSCNDESMIGDIAEKVEGAIKNLVVETDDKKPVIAYDLAENYMQILEDRFAGGEHDRRLKFGIESIDEKTGGVNPTDLIVLGGCPGMGKTELMATLSNAASDEAGGSLLFSLEMSQDELIERSIAIESGLPLGDLRNPRGMGDFEFAKVQQSIGIVMKKKFHVLDQGGLKINEIFAKAVDHKSRHPETNLICVDYAGLVNTSEYQDQVRALGEVGKKLKELAKKIQTPVILLAQVVSKNVEQRADKRPMASDLKGSSELQDAADWIIYPYRDVVYNKESPAKDVAEINFAKARHGTQGAIYMNWKNGHFTECDQEYAYSLCSQRNDKPTKGF